MPWRIECKTKRNLVIEKKEREREGKNTLWESLKPNFIPEDKEDKTKEISNAM